MKAHLTFHPKWYALNAGISFDSDFFCDPFARIERDFAMCGFLYDNIRPLCEKMPEPRPVLGSDLLACGYLFSQIFGCEVIFRADDAPQVVCARFSLDEAVERTRINLENSAVWMGITEQIESLRSKFGCYLPFINLMGPQNIALDLMGEKLFTAYYDEPERTRELLGNITRALTKAGQIFARGAARGILNGNFSLGVSAAAKSFDGVSFIVSNCSVDMVSSDIYKEFLLPSDLELARNFPGFGIHHCGGKAERYIDAYTSVPGLRFIEAGYGSDYKAVLSRCKGMGVSLRYSAARLASQSINEIAGEIEGVKRLVKDTAADTVLSCVGIGPDVSLDKACKFLEICERNE